VGVEHDCEGKAQKKSRDTDKLWIGHCVLPVVSAGERILRRAFAAVTSRISIKARGTTNETEPRLLPRVVSRDFSIT
jgi:hypothetical protein